MDQIKPPRSLVDQTHDILLDAICSGEFAPGQRLNQDELAARLNVSRQPVNSALSVLKANGFVQDTGRRGVVVSQFTADQFESVYEFRMGIEPFAIRLAHRRKPLDAPRQAAGMLRRGWKLAQSDDPAAQVRVDMAFHEMIYGWTGNPAIVSTMRMHWHHIRRAMSMVVRESVAARTSWEEHERIIDAMMQDQPDAAVLEMQNHIARAQAKTVEKLAASAAEG